jgi:site-specific DNA-cytosine methylase
MDLDSIIAQVLGTPPKPKPKPRRRVSPGIDLDAIVADVTGASRRQAPPPDLRKTWSAILRRESRHADPRPSRALHALLDTVPAKTREQILSERGVWLQRARERLPRQPPRGADRPPLTERRINRPDGQRVDVPAGALTAIEPFAGAGLLGLALHVEGCVTVDLCEISKWAIETQRANARHFFGLGWRPEPSNAWTWEPLRIEGNVDLLIGGPPCKPFSKGAELGRKGKQIGATANDNFFPRALDWIADLQPRLVAFENSSRLVKYKPFRRWLDTAWKPQLEALGYTMHSVVLYAADYGTPQNRTRAWIVCWPTEATWPQENEAIYSAPAPTHGAPGSPAVERGELLPWTPMHDRLISGCCGGYGLVDCQWLGNADLQCRTCSGGSNYRAAPNTTGDDGRRDVEQMRVKSKRKGRQISMGQYMLEVVSEQRPDQLRYLKFAPIDFAGAWSQTRKMAVGRGVTRYLSRAVVPAFSKPPAGLMIPPGLDEYADIDRFDPATVKRLVHQLQVMSVRDAAKLQDVPQPYEFAGPRTACFTQIGMGVPVNMGRAVARWLRVALGLAVRPAWYDKVQRGEVAIPEGLWPLDALDPCMAFPGVLMGAPYSTEQAWQDWSELTGAGILAQRGEVSAQARRKRPWEALNPLSRQARAQSQAAAEQMGQIYPDGMVVDGDRLWRSGWRPRDPMDAPHPFDDVYWFAEYLRERGQEPAWYNVWAHYYRTVFPKARAAVEQIWPYHRTRWGPVADLPTVFPSDAPFTERALADALGIDLQTRTYRQGQR